MKCVIFFIIMILCTSVVLGSLEDTLKDVSLKYEGQEVPGSLKKMIGDENINVYIRQKDVEETLNVGLELKEDKLKSIKIGEELDYPALKVFTDELTLSIILSSSNPFEAFKNSLETNKITWVGVGFKNKLKYGFGSFIMKIVNFFGGKQEENKTEEKEENKVEEKEENKAEEKEENKTEEKEENKTEEKEENKTEEKEENKVEEKEENKTEEKEENKAEEKEEHIVQITKDGFVPDKITIKVGESVKWVNSRDSGSLTKAMILGVRNCNNIKSEIFDNGESFKWTFNKKETCIIVEGVTARQDSKVVVEN